MPWTLFRHYLQKYKKFFYRNRVPWAKPENIKVDDSIMTVVIKTKGGRFIKNEIPVSKSLFGVVRLHLYTKGGVQGVAVAW
jgi:hypothetical protein